MTKRTLLLCMALCLSLIQGYSQAYEYEYGTNKFVQLGLNLNSLFQNNPAAGSGESQFGLGLNADLGYVVQKYKSILETDINLSFSLQKSGNDPINKGNDKIHIASHYAFTTSYSSNWYTAADLTIKSQFAPTYDGNTLSNLGDSLNLLSSFLSPLRMEFSLGEEYRFPQSPFYFFGGVAYNLMYVANDEIAQFAARDKDGNVIGSLHGNPLDGKALSQAGLTLKSRYRGFIVEDKLSYETDFNFFIDLLKRDAGFKKDNSPIDIEWNNNIAYIITPGISINLTLDLLFDKDIVFVSDSDEETGRDNFTKEGVSINSNFLLTVRKTFGNED